MDKAEDWYRKALTIFEELGDRTRMAQIYAYLGLLAEDRGQDPAPDVLSSALIYCDMTPAQTVSPDRLNSGSPRYKIATAQSI